MRSGSPKAAGSSASARAAPGSVEPWEGEAVPEGVPAVRLGVAELSAVYLGSVSLATLAAAGRVQSTDAAAAARIFSWFETARLSFWY